MLGKISTYLPFLIWAVILPVEISPVMRWLQYPTGRWKSSDIPDEFLNFKLCSFIGRLSFTFRV